MQYLRMSDYVLFTFDGQVVEWFELGNRESRRFHVMGIKEFRWKTDRKGRYELDAKSLVGALLLGTVMSRFPVTPELAAAAEQFAAQVRAAAGIE